MATRQERREQRSRKYWLAKDARRAAQLVGFKITGESGALKPPTKHPGRRRWGGESGKNFNGAARKYDRSRMTYVVAVPMIQPGPEPELVSVRIPKPGIPNHVWRRLLDNE